MLPKMHKQQQGIFLPCLISVFLGGNSNSYTDPREMESKDKRFVGMMKAENGRERKGKKTARAMLGVRGEGPYLFFTWNTTYGTLSPLGVPQQVILINNQFPGPVINSTSNNNLVINVFNNLDEPFLLTWSGVQQRKNLWQEGVLGNNCPISPGTNYTYHFQVKDQIGSFLYYACTALHRAGGAFGGIHINSRLLIPVPYPDPEDD
ncbi:hypothetical protein GH714_027796 [Hevea brasiliensis]|uniref:Plastocyanin-like domain-containing protein n=1 Tax=Hevea brasiliensis TaxID=3981 RepID=A0A6A6MLK0_HEVBR|nr:hypothetical protein GH714_027796 [Hevea brasiliensis]